MKKIDAWETTDGKIFKAKDDAGSHQYELDCIAELDKFVRSFCCHSMTTEDIIRELWEGRHDLMSIFCRGEE